MLQTSGLIGQELIGRLPQEIRGQPLASRSITLLARLTTRRLRLVGPLPAFPPRPP